MGSILFGIAIGIASALFRAIFRLTERTLFNTRVFICAVLNQLIYPTGKLIDGLVFWGAQLSNRGGSGFIRPIVFITAL